jgi:hypothetical protein
MKQDTLGHSDHGATQPQFVADGSDRLLADPEHRLRIQQLRESVVARHAAEMAEAGPMRRLILRCRMASEFRRERRKIEPSPESLYIGRSAKSEP